MKKLIDKLLVGFNENSNICYMVGNEIDGKLKQVKETIYKIKDFKKLNHKKLFKENLAHFLGVGVLKGRQRKKEEIIAVNQFYIDIDLKDNNWIKESDIKAIPLIPNMIINSGNGYHLRYILDKPLGDLRIYEDIL